MKPHIIFCVLLCYASITYSQNREDTIEEIDSLFFTYLFKVSPEAIKSHHDQLKKSEAINYYNGILKSYFNLMWDHGYHKNADSTFYYCHKFESLERSHPNKILTSKYLFNKGMVFEHNLGLTEEALSILTQAYKRIEKEQEQENKKLLPLISANIAVCYLRKKQYDKAVTILKKSLDDSISASPINTQYQLSYLSMAYQRKNMPNKSIPILHRVLEYGKKYSDTNANIYARNNIIYDYYLMRQYQKAIDSGLVIRKKLSKPDPFTQIPINSRTLSLSYHALGDIKKAIYYLNHAIDNTQEYNELPELYSDLATYYQKNDNTKLTIATYKKRKVIVDSIRAMEKKVFTDYYDTKIKFIDQTQKNEKILLEKNILTAQNDKQKLYIVSLIVGLSCILLVVLSSIIYRKYYKAEKKVIALKKKEKELLKNHIKVREDELAAILVIQARKTEELAQIESSFDNAIVTNDHHKILQSKKLLSEFINASESNDIFSERIESQYPGIVHQLQQEHPELSSNDIKHCLFLKLGLSLKESAQLLNVAIGTVKTSRNRAKAKMNLSDEVSLKEYIDQLVNEEILA